jgi:hypothetical protein
VDGQFRAPVVIRDTRSIGPCPDSALPGIEARYPRCPTRRLSTTPIDLSGCSAVEIVYEQFLEHARFSSACKKLFCRRLFTFDVHGSVHRECTFKYSQQDATLHNSFISAKCSACFRRFLRPSSGAQNYIQHLVFVKSVTATCRYRGGAGTPNGVRGIFVTP